MQRDFNTAILTDIAHRRWPMPDRPWIMRQTWHELLFAHWPVDAAALRPRIPDALELDLFDGQAWLGVVPFRMTNVAPRGVPPLPSISAFPELNVRTYVRVAEKPGVFFFSLDAGNRSAVKVARILFNLPYYLASMEVARRGGAFDYTSDRRGQVKASFAATYEPRGEARTPAPGSLEYFLTERYCLYHLDHRGRAYRLDIHHRPWAIQEASAAITRNTMAEASGLRLPDTPPLLHFAGRQDVVTWWPLRVR